MPKYPKYDASHSVQRASQLFALCGIENLFGNGTQNSKDISSWTPNGDWLTKSIAFFTPTAEEEHSGGDLCEKKKDIKYCLERLQEIYITLETFSSGQQPENAENKWDEMMTDFDMCASLADNLMDFNSITQNKYISEPAMKAAFGVAHGFGSMRYAMEELEAQNCMDEFSNFQQNYNAEKNSLNNLLDKYVQDCTRLNVKASEVGSQSRSIELVYTRLGDYIQEYEQKATELDKEIDQDFGENLKDVKLARTEIQLTRFQQASLELKHASEQKKASEERAEDLKQALIKLDSLSEEGKQLNDFRKKLAGYEDNESLLQAFFEITGGKFSYGEVTYNKEKDTKLFREFKRQNLSNLKENIDNYIFNETGISKLHSDASDLNAKLVEEKQKLNSLDALYADKKKLRTTLKEELISEYVPDDLEVKLGITDHIPVFVDFFNAKEFDYDKETADAKIEELKKKQDEQEKALEGKEKAASANPNLYQERKKLSRQLKEEAKKTSLARTTLEKEYLKPIKALEKDGNELQKRISALNRKTVDAKNTVKKMKEENPLKDVKDKMKKFSQLLEKNKRLLHKDSSEFKALKSLVDSYASDDATGVTLESIKDAAETYLGEKEKQRVNANSAMRNYRKNLAVLIRDYTGEKMQKEQFYRGNSEMLEDYSEKIEKLDSKINFTKYCNERQPNHKDIKSDLNQKINKTTSPAMTAHQGIEEAVSKYDQIMEKFSPAEVDIEGIIGSKDYTQINIGAK